MKLAICNEVYREWAFEDACQHASRAGCNGIEIAPFTLTDNIFEFNRERRLELRQIAAASGLEVVGLHWLLAGTEGLNLTSMDPSVRRKTADYLSALARLCQDLGGAVMVLGSPNERNLAAGQSAEQGRANAIDVLTQVVPALQEQGITLALEPLGPEETNFLMTAEEAISLIREIDSDRIGLQLDVKAMATERRSIENIIVDSAEWLVHFHANDPNRRGPGMGQVDFVPIIAALQQVRYSGWLSVEVFDYSPGIESLVVDSIGYLKQILQS